MTKEPLLDFEGYIIEIGDLDMGLRGSKRGRGVMLEVAEGKEVCIGGLTTTQCRALAARLRGKISVRIHLIAEDAT